MSLIGNRNALAFELTPVTPSWELRYGPERAAWAGLAMWVGGSNLCRHVVPGSNDLHDSFFIPLGPLVDWLVRAVPAIEYEERAAFFPTTRCLHADVERWGRARPPQSMREDDWLDAREEWWSRHFLSAGAEGARLPNVALVRDDEELVVTWAKPRFVGEDAPALLSETGNHALGWSDGVAVLDELAAQVAEWLRMGDLDAVYSWARDQHPLRAASRPLSEKLSLFTGRPLPALQQLFEVDGLGELLRILELSERVVDPAASPQCQILRDLSPSVTSELSGEVTAVGRSTGQEDSEALTRWRQARGIALDAARPAGSPIEAGQLAASELRHTLGLDGQPITQVADLLHQAGLSYRHSDRHGQHDRMLVAAREGGSLAAVTLETVRTARPWGQRFEAARALGHVLLDPMRSGTIGAASGPFGQETRHRRSGAFAAELLLPATAIEQASNGDLDGAATPSVFERLLEQYGVGARTAAYQLWNRGWLSSPDVRDELIDRFAAIAG